MTTRTFTALSLTAALAVAPGLAQAATWGGSANGGDPNVNYAYPNVSILFQQNSNRVGLRNAQVLMECVDRSDATVSIAAFSAGGPTGYSAPLRLNRWRKEFVSTSGGRTGQVTVTARMRPNGRGTAASSSRQSAETTAPAASSTTVARTSPSICGASGPAHRRRGPTGCEPDPHLRRPVRVCRQLAGRTRSHTRRSLRAPTSVNWRHGTRAARSGACP